MRFVIQVVEEAQVRVTQEADGSVPENGSYVSGSIGRGLMVLVGIGEKDTPAIADRMVEKMRKLRIFEDENGKTNLDLAAVGGEVLLVSQFTLYADCKKGNRPSFVHAGLPEMSEPLFNYIVEKCLRGFYEGVAGQRRTFYRCAGFGPDGLVLIFHRSAQDAHDGHEQSTVCDRFFNKNN